MEQTSLGNCLEKRGCRETVQLIGRGADSGRRGMVSVAGCRGGKSTAGSIGPGFPVEALQGDRRIEGLEGGEIELVENGLADSCAEGVVGVGCDADTPSLLDGRRDLEGRFALHLWQGGS